MRTTMSAYVDIQRRPIASKNYSNVTKCLKSNEKPMPPPRPEKPFRPPRPSRSLDVKPKIKHGPEDFPRTLTLDLPPHEKDGDLSKFLREMKLPQRIRITESFRVPGCSTTLNKDDVLLLHFIYDNPTVHATTQKGTHVRLPIHAEQEYEILPLDPRLDDMVYNGTQELMDATPLPDSVRVLDAFYSDNDDEDNAIDDIIEIVGLEHDKKRGKLLVGKCGPAYIKYSTKMTTVFTTMLFPGLHRMVELKEHKFPQRVRIPDDMEGCSETSCIKWRVLHLNKFSIDKCVVATRADDFNIYSIPVNTPIQFAHNPISVIEKHIFGLLPALYPRIDTSRGLVDPSQEALPTSMESIPQTQAQILLAWTGGEEEKSKAPADVSKANKKTVPPSVDLPGVPPELPRRPLNILEGRPRLPPPPGSRQSLDIYADSDEYEEIEEPVSPFLKKKSKENVTAANMAKDNMTSKEMNLQKVVTQLKMTVATGTRNDRKPSQPRGGALVLSDDDDYLEPIPQHSTIPRSFAPGCQTPSTVPHSSPMTRNLRDFTFAEVGDFLRQCAMEKYVDTFRENGIDGALLVEMTEVHMLDLKMSRFHALKLKIEIGKIHKPSLPH